MTSHVLMNKNTPVLAFEYGPERHEATRITRIETVAAHVAENAESLLRTAK